MLKWCARPLRRSAERKLPHSGPRPGHLSEWESERWKKRFSTSSCRGKAGFLFSSSASPRSLTIAAVTSWDMGDECAQCDGDEYDGRKGSHFFKTLKKISQIEDWWCDLIMATERNLNILQYFSLSLTSPSFAEFSCSATLPKAVLIWKQLSFHALSQHPELSPQFVKLCSQNKISILCIF